MNVFPQDPVCGMFIGAVVCSVSQMQISPVVMDLFVTGDGATDAKQAHLWNRLNNIHFGTCPEITCLIVAGRLGGPGEVS